MRKVLYYVPSDAKKYSQNEVSPTVDTTALAFKQSKPEATTKRKDDEVWI